MATQGSTTFHVALETLKLTAAQKANLSKSINAAALQELARLDLADGLQARIPKEWLGIWIDRFKAGTTFTVPDTGPAVSGPTPPQGLGKATIASVVLDGVKLTGAQQNSVQSAIRTAALGELGRIGPSAGLGVRYPKEWIGIWIGPYGKSLLK